MPLVIEMTGSAACPVILCDACAKRIQRGADGNYEWDEDDPQAIVYFLHKACSLTYRRRRPELTSWGPLEALPAYLLANLHTSIRESDAAAAFMEGE